MEDIVVKAEKIAHAAHQGQTRKFGADKDKPYIIHPQRVAASLADFPPEYQATAWLHDVIEDTDVTAQDLLTQGIPERVVNAVETMSKREGENYFDFIMRVRLDGISCKVKMADIEDNMSDLKEGSMKDKYRLSKYILKESYWS